MDQNLLSQYITETVAFDEQKSALNRKENDFSGGEYAEIDGRGVDK